MPRSAATAIQNSFIKGLITEATALNFPEDAATEADNVVFDAKGRVRRRLGLDYEDDYTTLAYTRSNSQFTEFTWEAAAGSGNLNFAVVQTGAILRFYEIDPGGALSPNLKASNINLATYRTTGSTGVDISSKPCQYASGSGKLYVVHPNMDPIAVSYNETTDTFSASRITVYIRDFEGEDDGLEIDEAPTTLSNKHHYNLKNQGWPPTVERGGGEVDPITTWAAIGTYPSNVHVWWLWKGASGEFDVNTDVKYYLGNSPAPKGHFVLNAFKQDRSSVSGLSGLTTTTAGKIRPSTICFSAGRVWYSGVNADSFSTKIYYSRIIERDAHIGQCYQDNDPTSEEFMDLLPSDGGVIDIKEIGTIVKLFAVRNAVLIFASNGIWSVTGNEGIGFTCTDYAVKKISAVESDSITSFVNVDGFPVWWNQDGIFGIQVDQLGEFVVQNISDNTIKSFLEEIPTSSIYYAKGHYNSFLKQVMWIYRSEAATAIDFNMEYDRALILSTQTGAFYKYSWDTTDVRVHGLISGKGSSIGRRSENVLDSSNAIVTDSIGETVFSSVQVVTTYTPSFRLLVSRNNALTWAQEKSSTYTDWDTVTPRDYSSHFTTGFAVHGETQKKFQVNYLYVFSEEEADSSCKVQAIWNFANSNNSGYYSTKQECYRAKTSRAYIPVRLKIRGSGIACQLKFTSTSGKPFNIIGWSTFETSNTQP